MKSFLVKSACGIGALALICLAMQPFQQQTTTSQVVTAANAFLSTLDDRQRKSVLYSFDDAEQRKRWSNLPTGFVPRGGISLKEMNATQQAAAMNLMAIVLSPMGLEKVNQIRLADDDFKANGSKRGPRGGGPPGGNGGPPPQFGNGGPPPAAGGPPPPFGGRDGQGGRPPFRGGDMFGKDLYYISFLGEPSITAPWMLQFGGHHLALNITIAGTKGVLTPTLTAILGLFLSRHASYGAVAISVAALGSLFIIKVLRSSIAPAISTSPTFRSAACSASARTANGR